MGSHVVEDSENDKMEIRMNESKLAVKAIDSIVFDYFKGLTSSSESDRGNAGLQLLKHLVSSQNNAKKDKEIQYILKRLVRGVGASTTISRAGFYTTLVGLLQTVNSTELDVGNVLETAMKQLHVGNSVNNKEDADAIVGQILTCGALIKSNKLTEATEQDIQQIAKTLTTASRYRTYHSALAYSFIVELLEKSSEEQFIESVWPVIEEELTGSWEKQTINKIHCLIVATKKFPNTLTPKYLKSKFGGHSLLNSKSSKHLFKLFWDNTSVGIIAHPSYESFGNYIASSKHFETFWLAEVDECLASPTKLREIETLKIFTDVLAAADPKTVQVSKFITTNFMKMAVASLKSVKLKKDDVLKAFYDEFFEGLFKWTTKVDDDAEKVNIIRKLILHPGSVTIEKYTTQRIIHQIVINLGQSGIREAFEIYKNIFLAKIQKDPNDSDVSWLNTERQSAGYMLQTLIVHKNAQTTYDWRQDQLKFIMVVGFFYTNDGVEVVGKKDDDGTITADLSLQMKNILYSSLQAKLPRLQDERKILLSLVEVCNEVLQRKNYSKYLRNNIDEKILKAWKEMQNEVMKKKKTEDNLKLVFHILLLHMGLQLFREPDMAKAAIWDLEKCMEKMNQKKGTKKPKSKGDLSEDEPDWIEVVIDLFLHLLSHNTSSLRNIVNAVFPHLCDSLSLTAIHQILSVLDMQDGNNPLTTGTEREDEQSKNKNEKELSSDENNSEESDEDNNDEDDEEDDEDDEELMEEEEEESNFTDVLRNAVSTALIGDKRDVDQDSIDLNDMDDEEGKRLDEALSNIFKTMKKPKQYKKTKSYRIETTTTMHFRIRVLDLIEIYIQNKPNLLITVEIMISLFNMIEFCTDNELKPLANKVERVLGKLTALRQFIAVKEMSRKNICDYLRLVIEKKVKAPAFDIHNKLKSQCCVFLIVCSKLLENNSSETDEELFNLLFEYLDDFVKSRNPIVTATILQDIFKMRWHGTWKLAKHLTKIGLLRTTRTYRRIQIIELIDTLYKTHELIRQDLKLAKHNLKSIEKQIQLDVKLLSEQQQISVREFNTLLNVLVSAHRCHVKIPLESNFNSAALCEDIQAIRKKVKLENSQSYSRFCTIFGTEPIRNNEVVGSSNDCKINGHVIMQNGVDDDDEGENTTVKKTGKNLKKTKEVKKSTETNGNALKRKKSIVCDNRKEKRLRKEARLKALSKGIDVLPMSSDSDD